MTDDEKLIRDIETMQDSLNLLVRELSIPHRTSEEKAAIRQHIGVCMAELEALGKKLYTKS